MGEENKGFGMSAPEGPPCPGTGLTPRQKQAMVDSWDVVKKDLKGHGVKLFLAFFKAHPAYQDYFKAFKGRPFEELETCPKLRAHGAAVMFAMSSIVSNLDDVECLVELVKKNATNHYARNIKGQQFDDLMVVISQYFSDAFGPLYDDLTRSGWESALKLVGDVSKQTMTELSAED